MPDVRTFAGLLAALADPPRSFTSVKPRDPDPPPVRDASAASIPHKRRRGIDRPPPPPDAATLAIRAATAAARPPAPRPGCAAPECSGRVYIRGVCSACYQRALGGDDLIPLAPPQNTGRYARTPLSVVARIRSSRSAGQSLADIAAALNAEGVPPVLGKTWRAVHVEGVLWRAAEASAG